MITLSTHVLDTALGQPADAVKAILSKREDYEWKEIGYGFTNADGRIQEFLPANTHLELGIYQIRFEVNDYFKRMHEHWFFPWIEINFQAQEDNRHYHVPLLLSPYGYSTYRGS